MPKHTPEEKSKIALERVKARVTKRQEAEKKAILKASESHEKKMAREHAMKTHLEKELARAKREAEREEKKMAREAAKIARENAKEERMEAMKAKRDAKAAEKEAKKKEREAKMAEKEAKKAEKKPRAKKAVKKPAAKKAEKKPAAKTAEKMPVTKMPVPILFPGSDELYGFSNPVVEKRAEISRKEYDDKLEKEVKKLSKKMLPLDAEREAKKKIDAKYYISFF